jgi:hypothetical protein
MVIFIDTGHNDCKLPVIASGLAVKKKAALYSP